MTTPKAPFFYQSHKSFVYILLLISFFHSLAQDKKNVQIKLFVECSCERGYIRQEIKFVNHVRDQAQANVQLFIYDIANGSGGRTYKLEFEGKEEYQDITEKIDYETNVNMTSDEVRQGLVKSIKTGLLPYLIKSDLANDIQYTITNKGLAEQKDIDFDDPWNNWIFEI